ncbi:MAG: polysaccharide biosynthesis tyrosine autokinase, partial [Planctomycetota bacterium]
RDEHDSVQRELQAAEDSLGDVRRASGLTDLADTGGRRFQHTITLRLNDLELQQNDLILEIRQVQAAMETLEELAKGPITVQVEHQIENDPVMVVLAQQLAFQKSALAGSLARLGENHREVRQAQELISEIEERRRIRQVEIAEQTRQAQVRNAEDQLVILTKRLDALGEMRKEAAAKKGDLDLARIQYEKITSIRDERREMLDSIKEQIEKLKIMHDDPETPKVLSVGAAPEPLQVSSPRWEFYFPGGTILGLLSGAGLAFLIELLSDLVRRPRDVSRYLHIPLLGVIPDAAEDERARDVDLCHVVRQAPYSVISESYRRFRTNLKLSGSAEPLKVLLVSSGMAGDGTTSVAVNLAATLVAENKKVLLIDANFRRPSLQTIFPKAGASGSEAERAEFGLSTLLTGLCSYEDAKRSNVVEGLDIIDAGPLPSNPAELLDSYQMEQLIKDRRKSHDYVIIDTPPVLLVSDAKVLARFVDGTVLVFNAGATRRGAALRTIRELKEVNAAIVGCVLLAVKAIKGGYFQEQFRSYRKYQKLQLAHSR